MEKTDEVKRVREKAQRYVYRARWLACNLLRIRLRQKMRFIFRCQMNVRLTLCNNLLDFNTNTL